MLIVAGCLPQRYKELAKMMPEVDLFIGAGEYQNIVHLLEGNKRGLFAGTPTFIHNAGTPRKIATAKHAVYIKIAEGCFHGCSFCVIPKIRGRFRSRPVKDIVAEAKKLIAAGARELNLIGQDTTSYGMDLKDDTDLAMLVRELCKLDGDFWIRIMYAYPTSVSDDLINEIAVQKKVCKYLDIPVQHISDKVLKAMRRKENGADIRALLDKLRARVPGITLRTSLIVGFPGEMEASFKELLEFVKEGHFDNLGVFTYSKEEGTAAAKLSGQVSRKVKEKRQRIIMKAQEAVAKELHGRWLEREARVLVGSSEAGRTEGQAPDIDGITMITLKEKGKGEKGKVSVGEFVTVKIIGVSGYDLVGEIC